jgi:pimeloyl-[acyl-carrier protein] methyl ester esterase
MRKLHQVLAGFFLAGAAIVAGSAHADETVVRDRFSDEIVGQGPDLVFIPGLASSRDTWKATAERLKGRYRLHLIQVAGFAGEPARANAQGPVLVPTAEAIDAYLVEQHLAPAVVIGHSLGGTTILYLAEHHGNDLKKALIVDSAPFYPIVMFGLNATVAQTTPIADAIRSGKSKMSDAQSAKLMAGMATSQSDKDMISGWSKASDPSAVANALADDMTLDLRPGLAAISTPITLVYPDYAAVGTPKGAVDRMYHSTYTGAKTVTFVPITDSLHFVMLDQPAQFNAALDAFLTQ